MVSLPLSGARRRAFRHRVQARMAARARPATGFRSHPEPRTIGRFAKGRQLLAGNLQFAGHLVEAPGISPWDLTPPTPEFAAALHGFTWLDDLAAVGDARARSVAADWTQGWIARFGGGQGPGWTPELTARRMIRLINHAILLLRGQDTAASDGFFRSLGQQTIFLSRTWSATPPGLARIEAVAGTIYAGLSLLGMEETVGPAITALDREASRIAEAGGTVPSRNPLELLDVLTLFNWAVQAIEAAGQPVPGAVRHAVEKMVPTLRALRHADGGLARFHGGGRGLDGRLDLALSESGVKARPPRHGVSMGYAHISAGRSTLVVDAAPPPVGAAAATAHASTLAFELTSGRRPVIVSCGAGAQFGPDWHRAGRATPSQSTLGIDGHSSARIDPAPGAADRLRGGPKDVQVELSLSGDGTKVETSHDGYRTRFGLIHGRTLDLSVAGRALTGDDYLVALTPADRAAFDRAMDDEHLQGIPFTIRFHLHPDTEAEVDMGGKAISIALKSGEIWVLRHESLCDMAIKPSVYLENGRLRPRAAQQVVLTGRAMSYATQIRWSLAKAQDTPNALRDYADATEEEETETADD